MVNWYWYGKTNVMRFVLNLLRIKASTPVAYPGFFFWRGVLQIQLRIEGRQNGDVGAVAP
jgi:hypothetical protein